MPRRKRSKRNKANDTSSDDLEYESSMSKRGQRKMFVDNVVKCYTLAVDKLDQQLEADLKRLKMHCDLIVFNIPKEFANKPMTYNSSDSGISLSDPSNKYAKPKTGQRRSRSHSPSFAVPKVPRVYKKRVSRSCSRSRNDKQPDKPTVSTPANQDNLASSCGLITPKYNPNVPLTVMRRPRQGEMVLSLSGSPLLVSSSIHDSGVNVIIPLENGSVVSVLPQPGLLRSDLPVNFDVHTREQLETVLINLKTIMKN